MNGDELDENGVFDLLNGVVRRAQMDAQRGNPKNAADAAAFLTDLAGDDGDKMPQWYHDMRKWVDGFDARHAPKAQPAPAPAPSPFAELDARQLDAMGVSTQWAGMTSTQMDELARKQAHRDRAAALGVDPRYLPPMED